MLTRLGLFTVRRRRAILVSTLVLFLAAGAVYGGNVATRLSSGGFDNPSSDSSQGPAPARATGSTPGIAQPGAAGGCRQSGDGGQRPGRPGGTGRDRQAGRRNRAWPTSPPTGAWATPRRCGSRDAHQALVVARITGTDKEVSEADQAAPAEGLRPVVRRGCRSAWVGVAPRSSARSATPPSRTCRWRR